MSKIVFAGGLELESRADPRGLVELFASIAAGKRGSDQGQPLPTGYAAIHTDHGPVYVNVTQVAFVRG